MPLQSLDISGDGARGRYLLVVVNDFGDDEVEPLLGERGVEVRFFGERS